MNILFLDKPSNVQHELLILRYTLGFGASAISDYSLAIDKIEKGEYEVAIVDIKSIETKLSEQDIFSNLERHCKKVISVHPTQSYDNRVLIHPKPYNLELLKEQIKA